MNKLKHLLLLGFSYGLKGIEPWNPPYQFSIEPTNSCNFKCIFCPQSDPEHRNNRKQGFLTIESMRSFLVQISKIAPGNKNISLTLDGEPTLNKDLPEFIRLINMQGLLPRFSTNGKGLTPPLIDKLVKTGSFLVSTDFACESNYFDNVRGKTGDFEVVLKNLRYLVDIARNNPEVKVEIVNISHFSGADKDLTLGKMRNLFPSKLPRNIVFWSREFHNFCGHLRNRSHKKYSLCPYPWTSFAVTWDGNVVPCCRDTRAKTILGNVFIQSIEEIWNGEEYKNLRARLINKEPHSIAACRDCDLPWSSGSSRWKIRYMLSSLLRR